MMAPAMARLFVPFLSDLEASFVFLFLCSTWNFHICDTELLNSKQVTCVQQACRIIWIHPRRCNTVDACH